jgi:hypothetical protein
MDSGLTTRSTLWVLVLTKTFALSTPNWENSRTMSLTPVEGMDSEYSITTSLSLSLVPLGIKLITLPYPLSMKTSLDIVTEEMELLLEVPVQSNSRTSRLLITFWLE